MFGFDGGLGEVRLDDVGDVAGANLILRDAAGFKGLGVADGWSAGLQLTGTAGYTFYQAVLVVEGTLDRHAFHPVS